MSTARVFAHLIECMYRSAYPFSNIADVIVSQIVPCPGANLVEKIFEQPIFIVSRSFAKFIKRNFIHYRQMPCIRGGTFCSELVYYNLSQCWRKEQFEISRCVEFLVVVTINLCPLSISPGTRRKCSLVGSIEVCQRSASHLANSDIYKVM